MSPHLAPTSALPTPSPSATPHPLARVQGAHGRTLTAASCAVRKALSVSRADAKDTLRDLSQLLSMPEGILISSLITLSPIRARPFLREIFL